MIADTPQHTYQVLTKRSARLPKIAAKLDWPPNLWMGVSVENADDAVPRRPPARRARGRPVPVLRAAAGAAGRPGPGGDRLGNRWRRIRTRSPAARSCLGRRDPRCVRERGSAVLLQAVGWPNPEGWRPGAGRPEMGPDARATTDQRSLITLSFVSLPTGSTDAAPISSRSRTAGLASLARHRAVSTRSQCPRSARVTGPSSSR